MWTYIKKYNTWEKMISPIKGESIVTNYKAKWKVKFVEEARAYNVS